MLRLFTVVFTLLLASNACLGDEPDLAQAAKDRAVVETLLRLKGMDVNSSPNWKAATLRHLETVKGTPKYVDLVEKLKLRGVEDELFRVALADPTSTTGSKAASLLIKANELPRFEKVIQGTDETVAVNAIQVLGLVADEKIVQSLKPLVIDANRSGSIRVAAAMAIGKNRRGQQYLFDLAKAGTLPQDLKFTAANILLASADEAIRRDAANYLTLPASVNSQPLPPVAEMLKMKGDPIHGKQVFQTTGTCAKCHKVRGEGKEVGPDLSEIGSKLAGDALFLSILDPSAGISHNFDAYTLVTTSGTVLTGLLINRTDQAVTIRTAESIDKEVPASEIDELQKSKTSLMPADLQKLMSVQDLVDVVAYLVTLKK
jgi:putative heme-binding domain-containing protein